MLDIYNSIELYLKRKRVALQTDNKPSVKLLMKSIN